MTTKPLTLVEMRSHARSWTETALRTLGAALTARDCPWSTRIAAGNALLDRAWGKAENVSISLRGDAATLSDAELVARLEQLRSERASQALPNDGAKDTTH